MIKSMTAFGRAKELIGGKEITVELKSVNSRYLDTNIKLPRLYTFLEDKVRAFLTSCGVSRGKLDVYITVEQLEKSGVTVALDKAYTESYIKALRELADTFGLKDDISVMTVAANPDIFAVRKPEEDAESDWKQLETVLGEALEAFNRQRVAEGERLAADIRQKMDGIRAIVAEISAASEREIASFRGKFEQRIRSFLDDNGIAVDEARLLTECAIFTDKVAIDEELVRLNSHFASFEEILEADEPVGRKLDFLMQEINRETNTIGSKVSDSEIARKVVDVKSELEKIREQIQNFE